MNFLEAIQFESLENIKKILGGSEEIPAIFQFLGCEAVKTAVICEREDVVQLLLEKNCRVNQTTNTPLHIATKLGNIKLVEILLEKNASITVLDEDGDSPLHIAFQNIQMEIVDLMLKSIKQSSEYLNLKNKQGLTHLHIACTRGNEVVVDGFLAAASDAIKMVEDHTVYKHLQSTNNLQCEKIKQPIEPNKQTTPSSANNLKSSEEAEDLAGSSDSDNEEYLQKSYGLFCKLRQYASTLNLGSQDSITLYNETAEFHIVCSESHPDVVRRYIREGANVNALLKDLDWNGFPEDSTPLHCAVEGRKADNAKLLVEHGADAMLMDENQATPLHVALYNDDPMGDGKTLNLLYEVTRDKSINLKDKNGMSFLHVAASRNDLETVRLYLDPGENVNQQIGKDEYYGVSYFTPLHFAVQYRHQEMVELLIEHGADVNSRSIDTPLHVACEFGHQGIIELLLKKGARADEMAGVFEDKTTLHLLLKHIAEHRWAKINAGDCKDEQEAVHMDYKRKLALFDSCAKKLLEAGCDINETDKNGDTALHYACATQFYNGVSTQKLLWLGADINVENNKGETPMEMRKVEWYCGIAVDFMILYHHVQELKALGMEVNPKNEECCKKIMEKRTEWSKWDDWEFNGQLLTDEELAARDKQRLDEVEKMKKVMLTKKISLYDFVRFEPQSNGVTVKNAKLKTVLKEIQADTGYPVYGCRIWLQWKKALEIFLTKNISKRKSMETECTVDSKRFCV